MWNDQVVSFDTMKNNLKIKTSQEVFLPLDASSSIGGCYFLNNVKLQG
jgi:hypothetical protein